MALRPDEWIRDHESLESYGNDLMHKVVQRNQQPRTGLQATRVSGNELLGQVVSLMIRLSVRESDHCHADQLG
jgi:hypothetical protein